MRLLMKLVGALVIAAILVVVGLLMLPGDKIAQVAVDQLKTQTGRQVTLSGNTTISYYPVLGVSTGQLTIANADWSNSGPMMTADSLKVGVDFMSLLSGAIKITGLEAVRPAILLERAKDGRVNWELGVDNVAPSGQPAGSSNKLALSLDRALISGGTLRYVDHGAGTDLNVRDANLDLQWPVYRGQATFSGGLTYGAQPLTFSGQIANLAGLIEGEVTAVSARIASAAGSVGFDGRAGTQPQAQGTLTVDLKDTSGFLSALGVTGVSLPRGLGRAAKVSADLTYTTAALLSLRNLSATLDQNSLNGEADLDLSKSKPVLTAKLAAGSVDLTGLSEGGSGGGAASDGWSKAAIDASALGMLDGQIALSAKGLSVAGLTFGAAKTQTTIENSRAAITLSSLAGYDGTISGSVVANNRSGLSVAGNVKASGVEMQKLLGDLAGITRFTGQANANIEFLSSGQSVHAIMNAISGKGGISMGRGTIQGIDLDKLMRQGMTTGGTTVFDSLGATFTMDKGNLYNKDLLLKLPAVSATGEGRVGLGKRDIDYLFTPKVDSINDGKGLAIPVAIKGPWSSPSIRPDMEKAIDLNFKEEKEKAKKELENKVKEKLGVTNPDNPDEKVEDAVKRKLEEEAKKGLLNLLNKK
ncbi:AsmA family protein [Thalassobius vesicularis]|uniref:AsmA family protein n=1 Tax=Thalassobius vesicularis TaxID=1294297 RepID=A0A4S3MCU0_9RHOB|nr:AsmA family protein [Thalassobius vesicularis]THD76392.1 AsmA family protein [Thalassobius vesicularis]